LDGTMASAPGYHAQHLLLIQGHLHDAPDAGEHDCDLVLMLVASKFAFLQLSLDLPIYNRSFNRFEPDYNYDII
jgi:hypothetical protein